MDDEFMDEREWRENRGPDEPPDLCHECGRSDAVTRQAERRQALWDVADVLDAVEGELTWQASGALDEVRRRLELHKIGKRPVGTEPF